MTNLFQSRFTIGAPTGRGASVMVSEILLDFLHGEMIRGLQRATDVPRISDICSYFISS